MFVSKGNVCVTEHIASLSSTIARTTCKMQYFYFFLICVYKKYFDIIKIKRKLATVIYFPGTLHVTGAITSMFFFTSRHYICRHTSPLFDTRDEVAIFTTRSINNRYYVETSDIYNYIPPVKSTRDITRCLAKIKRSVNIYTTFYRFAALPTSCEYVVNVTHVMLHESVT